MIAVRRPLLLVAPLFLMGQASQAARHDAQAWEQINLILPVMPHVRLTLEEIARLSDRQGGLYTTEFGALASYQVAQHVDLGFGYRHVGFYNGNTGADEERLRQQIVVTFSHFTTRLRIDERFNPGGDEIGFRIRPLIRYNLPLKAKGVSLFASHESFLLANSTSWGQRRGYERMRNIVGVAFPVSRAISADVGYLNQYRPSRFGAEAQMDHALNLQLTINLAAIAAPKLHD